MEGRQREGVRGEEERSHVGRGWMNGWMCRMRRMCFVLFDGCVCVCFMCMSVCFVHVLCVYECAFVPTR